jgi:hypothetical protein
MIEKKVDRKKFVRTFVNTGPEFWIFKKIMIE